jgi:hypothetical protein
VTPEEVESLWQVHQEAKRPFLERMADGRAHALDELRGLIPEPDGRPPCLSENTPGGRRGAVRRGNRCPL